MAFGLFNLIPVYCWILLTAMGIFAFINESILRNAFKYASVKVKDKGGFEEAYLYTFFGFNLFFGKLSLDEELKKMALYYRLTFVLTIVLIFSFIVFFFNFVINTVISGS
jgi:glucan phosphoethanolaminetransferase (alkaline phosphatase superfamily)